MSGFYDNSSGTAIKAILKSDKASTTDDGIVALSDNPGSEIENNTKAVTPAGLYKYLRTAGTTSKSDLLDIGVPGRQGFGVGIPDATEDELYEIGLTPMNGYDDKTSDNYGNFMHDTGGQFIFVPHFFVRYGSEESDVYETYGVNSLDIKNHWAFETEEEANKAGWFTPRAFYDGSSTKWRQGFFIAKYIAAQKNLNSVYYPISDGSGYWCSITPPNMMTYTKNVGEDWFVGSAFNTCAIDMLLFAHAQHSTGTAYCAWWKGKGAANYPMQWSASTPAMYSHNGQKCGLYQVSNCRWEFTLGLSTPSTSGTTGQTNIGNSNMYILNPEIQMKDMTGEFGGETDAWGTEENLTAKNYYKVDYSEHFDLSKSRNWYWNISNQMFSQPVNSDGTLDTMKRDLFMIMPDSEDSVSSSTNTVMGPCLNYYSPVTTNLALYFHGQNYSAGGSESVFSRSWTAWRTDSNVFYSFRLSGFLRTK